MEVIVVLSHLMSKEGLLNTQTLKRIKKAIEICGIRKSDFLVSSGWAYRNDCSLAIGKVVRDYIKKKFDLGNCQILYDINSRDTVGDAYFIRKKISNLKLSDLIVVTSDYHVKRTKNIFRSFFPKIYLEIIGVETNCIEIDTILRKERASLSKFKKTFKNVDFSDDTLIHKILKEKHPYYNGKIFPKI